MTQSTIQNRDLDKVNLLDLAPVRAAPWEEFDEGRVIIERPKPGGRGLQRLRSWARYWLAVRRIRLDVRGSFAWRHLDGRCTVGELAEAMRRHFGEEVEPVEERVGQLVRLLYEEDLLLYPGWDEIPASTAGSSK